jgi:hypothetical protein
VEKDRFIGLQETVKEWMVEERNKGPLFNTRNDFPGH